MALSNENINPEVPVIPSNIDSLEGSLEGRKEAFKQFLLGLGLDSGEISFRCIAEEPELKQAGAPPLVWRKRSVSVDGLFAEMDKHNKRGYAIFWQPQDFEIGKPEKGQYLAAVRYIVIDCDKQGIEVAKRLKALAASTGVPISLAIETSYNKTQLIWRIAKGSEGSVNNGQPISADRISALMKRLSLGMGADKNACKAVQVFRVPGFYWQKRGMGVEHRYLSRILYSDGGPDKLVSDATLAGLEKLAGVLESYEKDRLATKPAAASGNSAEVPEGERHTELLRLASSLLAKGVPGSEVKEKCREEIINRFADGERWLVSAAVEIERVLHDAIEVYFPANKERDKAREKELIGKLSAELNDDKTTGVSDVITVTGGVPAYAVKFDLTGANVGEQFSDDALTEKVMQLFSSVRGAEGKIVGSGIARRGSAEPWIVRVQETGCVMCWDEVRRVWADCGDGGALSGGGIEVLCRMFDEVQKISMSSKEFRDYECCGTGGEFSEAKWRRAVKQMLSSTKMKACLQSFFYAKGRLPDIKVEDFNAINGLISLAGGKVLDIRKALSDGCDDGDGDKCIDDKGIVLRDVQAQDMITRNGYVTWKGLDPEGAMISGWLKFLGEIFADSPDVEGMIEMTQRIFGYSLSNSIDEQKVFLHYGSGANGKSKVLSALRKISGEYAYSIPGSDITSRGGSGSSIRSSTAISYERLMVDTENRRLGIIEDLPTGVVWSEELLKAMTSGSVVGRKLFKERRQIINRCKFHIGVNELPQCEGENEGIMRRLQVIPYEVTFVPNSTIENKLNDMIEQEASGILAWAVRGWIKSVHTAKQNYKKMQDSEAMGLKYTGDIGGMAYTQDVRDAVIDYRTVLFETETSLKQCIEVAKDVNWRAYTECSFFDMENRHSEYKWLSADEIKLVIEESGFSTKELYNKTGRRSLGAFIKRTFPNVLRKRAANTGGARGYKYFVKVLEKD